MKKNEYDVDALRKETRHTMRTAYGKGQTRPAFFRLTSQVDKRTSFKESLHCFTARKGKLGKAHTERSKQHSTEFAPEAIEK